MPRVISPAGGAGRGAEVIALRPEDERQHTSHVGMVIFLASWAMMFGALFFSYVLLRLRAPGWPPPGFPQLPVLLPAFNTAVMVLSGVAMQRGVAAGRRGDRAPVLGWLVATAGLGVAFVALQAKSWLSLWAAGLRLSGGAYASMFYLLTIFHALHVLVGLGLISWLIPAARHGSLAPRRPGGPANVALGNVAWFWHFVGLVWVLIFVTVYLL